VALDRDIGRRAVTVAVAVSAYGLAFGVLCAESGLTVAQAAGFSALVFSGSAQFAAVTALAAGGSVAAAAVSGLLLNLRSLGFGVALAPVLDGPWWKRLLASQLLIDESAAQAMAEEDPDRSRQAFWAGGVAVFVLWNLSTLAGVALGGAVAERLTALGVDAAFPAGFLALLAPRLTTPATRVAAVVGAAVALALTPLVAPGLPVVLASVGALAGLAVARRRPAGTGR
jgi:predicted branched-subunit amino acid permease